MSQFGFFMFCPSDKREFVRNYPLLAAENISAKMWYGGGFSGLSCFTFPHNAKYVRNKHNSLSLFTSAQALLKHEFVSMFIINTDQLSPLWEIKHVNTLNFHAHLIMCFQVQHGFSVYPSVSIVYGESVCWPCFPLWYYCRLKAHIPYPN